MIYSSGVACTATSDVKSECMKNVGRLGCVEKGSGRTPSLRINPLLYYLCTCVYLCLLSMYLCVLSMYLCIPAAVDWVGLGPFQTHHHHFFSYLGGNLEEFVRVIIHS